MSMKNGQPKVIAEFTVPAVYSYLKQDWAYSGFRVRVTEQLVEHSYAHVLWQKETVNRITNNAHMLWKQEMINRITNTVRR